MKKILLALLLTFSCFFANAQCDYLNGDLEDWTTFPLDLGTGPQDVMLPDNHISSVRFLFQLIEIFFLGNPDPLILFANDPQLFMGIDKSTDASSGEFAVQLQADAFLNIADLWSVIACDEIQDSFKVDIRHVGTSSDTMFIYGAYDENVAPLPESQATLDTLAAYFLYQLVFDTITEYTTFTFPVFINDPNAPVDTFSFLALASFGDPDSYFLIDNIRFSDPVDDDSDGYTADVDCDDTNPNVNPGATETCNGIDDNCDGEVDEGLLSTFYFDSDGDGYGDAATSVQECDAPTDYVANNDDCDDTNANVNPGAPEICDGLDNDCNGTADDGLIFQDYYLDADGDGYGDGAATNACESPGTDYVLLSGDCDDNSTAVNPGAAEICDGIDNDCNGEIDDNVTYQDYFLDGDGDGYGTGAAVNDCQSPGTDYVLLGGDCNDGDMTINPGAAEICDGIDNDCNGEIDDNVTYQDYYLDSDGDGYGTGAAVNDCQSPGADYVLLGGDCNDGDMTINPGAAEICDGIDNDCNGMTDDGVTFQDYYYDADGDGYGGGTVVYDCQSPGADYVLLGGDCNDGDMTINPGAAEICNGIDDDCDGTADDGLTFQDYYLDGDGDGYGTGAAVNDCQSPGADYVLLSGDCDDNNTTVNPGVSETCNGIDDNCDGEIDEGVLATFYLDSDGDGFGAAFMTVQACSAPANYVANFNDCDDSNADVNPDATEICDGIDNDCNGLSDDGLTFQDYYLDGDSDGYGTGTAVNDCQSPGTDYVLQAGDCDDTDPNVNPGATEIPANGIDDDCDGVDDPSNTDELSELGIRIFPNPVSEVLWLENVPPVGFQVELVNLIGQTVGTSQDNVRIDCQHLPSGAYFIKITEEKTMRRKVSLVVKK